VHQQIGVTLSQRLFDTMTLGENIALPLQDTLTCLREK
jgi:ABC-type transporter Mla maintaining outer membrane lipid asymmetry ATPase subunit MlaF